MAAKTPGVSSVAQAHKSASAARRAKGKTTHENPLLPHRTLQQMHALLRDAAKLERSAAALLRKHQAAGITGNEAAFVSLAIHLLPQDKVSASSSDIMLRLLRGARPAALTRELRAKSPRTVEDHGVLPPISSSAERLAVALGVALGVKSAQTEDSGKNSVVLAYLELIDLKDASWLSILQTAGRFELPIVFLCLDAPAVSSQTHARLWQQLRGATLLKGGVELIPVIPVDGHDVVAMYRVAQESVLRARTGIGPTVLWPERWTLGSRRRNSLVEFEQYLGAKGLLANKRNHS